MNPKKSVLKLILLCILFDQCKCFNQIDVTFCFCVSYFFVFLSVQWNTNMRYLDNSSVWIKLGMDTFIRDIAKHGWLIQYPILEISCYWFSYNTCHQFLNISYSRNSEFMGTMQTFVFILKLVMGLVKGHEPRVV